MHRALVIAIAVCWLLAGCERPQLEQPRSASQNASGKLDPNDPEFKKRAQARLQEMKREESIREEAPWPGRTGLPDDDERELPRYLRREFGQLLSQPGSLRAQDLHYLGVFVQGVETVHYWRINYGSAKSKFAYVVVAPADRQVMGWGDRTPPK
ncbi:hypothetical protein J7U46_22385 [Pelomonas sp. V22]|uniref:hypothetical protein n=1 Tax=Pelomonas sp. V22 TaxID=2822139 RepID=UPI0024A8BCDA|nr:hypothetical protein [Pelomonas sp. V22]MDI4635826.1 hypothetical protein [Pelomonas sp. V22]MDI4635831.1 hypothetical protein [Pelomonas sp. V22]